MSTLDDIDLVFDALAHEARRHILLLLSHLGGELPSGYLAKRFQHSWPTTTRHLGVLEKAGLIEVRREGRGSHYRINRERLQRVVGGWLGNLTPPTPDQKWTPQSRRKAMSNKNVTPRIFRVTVEVSNLEAATKFYAKLLGIEGKRHPGARHYFDCGGVILAVLDVSQGGLTPTPGPKSLYLAVSDVNDVQARAKELKALAPYEVHGQAAGEVIERPWGERSFYAVDAWGNDLCFCEEGTLYT